MAPFNFSPFPELFTERLHLRQLKDDDASEIFLLRSDAVVNQYLGRKKATHIDEAKDFIEKINAGIKNNQCLYWAICFRNNSKLIGTVCLWNISTEENKAETGYELLPTFHGQGIMQEALTKVLDFCFNTLQFQLIEACTVTQNLNSIKVLEKNNFKRDLELESKMDPNTEVEGQVIYSLKKANLNLPPSSW